MPENQNFKSCGWPLNRPIIKPAGPKLPLTSVPVKKKEKKIRQKLDEKSKNPTPQKWTGVELILSTYATYVLA